MIHIDGVKITSESHNQRLRDFDYVRKDLTPNNEQWIKETISDAKKRIHKTYKEKVGQKMQEKAKPIREGVVLIQEHHTIKDLHKLANRIEKEFGIKTIQMYTHKDEGHWKEIEGSKEKEWKPNLHAHMVFDWTDENGKSYRLKSYHLSKFQDIVAEELGMKRGKESSLKHLNAIQYKVKVTEEELNRKVSKLNEIAKTNTDTSILEKSSYMGLKKTLNKEKATELIQSNQFLLTENKKISNRNKNLNDENKKLKEENSKLKEFINKQNQEITKQENISKIQYETGYEQAVQKLVNDEKEYQKQRIIFLSAPLFPKIDRVLEYLDNINYKTPNNLNEIHFYESQRKELQTEPGNFTNERFIELSERTDRAIKRFEKIEEQKRKQQIIQREEQPKQEVKKEEQQQEHKPRFRR